MAPAAIAWKQNGGDPRAAHGQAAGLFEVATVNTEMPVPAVNQHVKTMFLRSPVKSRGEGA
jgi:hypothetical protein